MKTFILPMPDMFIGEMQERAVKNANKEITGTKTLVKLEYLGGYVLLEVDKGYAEANLKVGMQGEAAVKMEPSMSGRSVQDGKFAFIDTGFSNFKLVGFTPKK